MKRWFPWITGILIIAASAWTVVYLKNMHPLGAFGSRLGDNRFSNVGIRFEGATLVGRANGKRVWMIHAKSIDISKDRRTATFSGISQGTLMQDNKKVASIAADQVLYNTYTRNVSTPGKAKLSLVNGPSFKVSKVYWNAGKSKLVCEGGVDAVIGGNTMHGDRMSVDLAKKEITTTKISGQFKLPE